MSKLLFTGTHPDHYVLEGPLVHQPLIQLIPINDYSQIDDPLRNMDTFNWIIFTSQYTVDFFFKRLYSLGFNEDLLSESKIASIGYATSQKLSEHRLTVSLQPMLESSIGIIELFQAKDFPSQTILIPRSNLASSVLVEGLRGLGHCVTPLDLYTNQLPKNTKALSLNEFDRIAFTSASTVKNFHLVYGVFPKDRQYFVHGDETEKELKKWIDSDNIARLRP